MISQLLVSAKLGLSSSWKEPNIPWKTLVLKQWLMELSPFSVHMAFWFLCAMVWAHLLLIPALSSWNPKDHTHLGYNWRQDCCFCFYDVLLTTLLWDDFACEAIRRMVHLATSSALHLVSSAQIYLSSGRTQMHFLFFCCYAFIFLGYYLVFFAVSWCLSISATPPTTASQYF